MLAPSVGRPDEARAVNDFLDAAREGPAVLVIEGEPGIGKTTMWSAALDQARERGCSVLSARPAEVESGLAYGALTDLLTGADEQSWAELPAPQRRAVDQVLLRADPDGQETDPRAVAAACLSILERCAARSPVLVAVDDLQWLDCSSRSALLFALRRVAGRLG